MTSETQLSQGCSPVVSAANWLRGVGVVQTGMVLFQDLFLGRSICFESKNGNHGLVEQLGRAARETEVC